MKYAHIEKNTNKLIGWYSKDIHITTDKKSMKVEVDLTEEEILNMDEKELESIVDKHLKDNNIKYDYRELEGVSKDYIQTNLYTIIYTFPISECIEVTQEIWQNALDNNYNYYNTKTKKFEYKDFRTVDEIREADMELNKRKHETYLKDTEWVESYYIKHLLGVELIPEDSNKWNVINEREISKKYLREL